MAMIKDPNIYFDKGCGRCERFDTADCSTRFWIDGLSELRRICLAAGLTEHAKWGHPCYMHAGRNIAIFGAFRGDFRLTFMNPGLMKDPEGILEKQGPNCKNPGVLFFTDVSGVLELEPTIRAYLEELKGYAEAGIKPPQTRQEIDMPGELGEALDADPDLAEAFHALTPGRQRSYFFNIAQAKKPETRFARIEKFRDKIIAGKGALER